MSEKKYPIGGYAPGDYKCNCCICGTEFNGDKRAVQCEPCAVRVVKTISMENGGAPDLLINESQPNEQPAVEQKEWDSNRLIGRVKDRFIELEEKQWDWPSFYNGWLEGRADMLQQIKGWGQYKKQNEEEVAEVFVPCDEKDPRCCGGYTSGDGRSLCYVREARVPVSIIKK